MGAIPVPTSSGETDKEEGEVETVTLPLGSTTLIITFCPDSFLPNGRDARVHLAGKSHSGVLVMRVISLVMSASVSY